MGCTKMLDMEVINLYYGITDTSTCYTLSAINKDTIKRFHLTSKSKTVLVVAIT